MTATHPQVLATDLVLLTCCDSVAQREAWLVDSDAATRLVVSHLRIVHLLGQQSLLTQAHLFDGVVLLELGPVGLAHVLGVAPHELPIRISCREGSARRACDEYRQEGVEKSAEIALSATTASQEEAHRRIRQLQDRWLLFLDEHDLTFPMPAQVPFAERLPREVPALESRHAPPGATEPELVSALRGTARRSEVRALLSQARSNGLAPTDSVALERWWSRGYFAMIARQHESAWIDVVHSGEPARRKASTHSITLVEAVLTPLGDMPPSIFQTVVYHVQTLMNGGFDPRADHRGFQIGYVVLRAVETPDRRAERRSLLLRGILFLLLAAVAAAASAPWAAGAWALVAALIVVTFLQGVPWDVLANLLKLRRSLQGAAVHLNETSS